MARPFDARQPPATAAQLADSLVDFVAGQLESLARHHAPGLVLPRVFAGHAVGPDARSDLAFTLGLLFEAGLERVSGAALEDVVLRTLLGLDGARTDTFYSYRAAESLRRLGGYHDNPRLARLSAPALANLREVFDSTAAVERVRKGQLPRNYAVVVARCEYARQQLGLLDDSAILDELTERSRALVAGACEGWIDDSNEQRGQFDIYTPDILLFAEPLAGRLGDVWTRALSHVLADVDVLALPGGAVVWGRSIGALGLAMTVELASLGVGRGLVENRGDWLARAAWALDELRDWYAEGVIRAHQHRSTLFYRGPSRRLQMTLDVLGKLVQAALELRRAGAHGVGRPEDAWRPVDRMLAFGDDGRHAAAGAWAVRDRRLSFVLPLVGGYSADYLPCPRSPGLFEPPVSGPISGLPVVHAGGRQLVAAGVPRHVSHRPGGLREEITDAVEGSVGGPIGSAIENGAVESGAGAAVDVEWSGWAEVAAGPGQPPIIDGRRHARLRVEGRSLVVEETIELDAEPASIDALSLQLPALASRPLDVAFECDAPHRVSVIDVDGLAEYRSFWSELACVHQVDIEPARRVELRWRVRPRLRVASTAHAHPYDNALYEPLRDRIVTGPAPRSLPARPRALHDTDVLHVHWPEWWQGPDLARNREALERLGDSGVRIVWTQHNLLPHHFRDDDARELYGLWARAADAVIHHTQWGLERAMATHDYRADAVHRVIGHGHWGARFAPHAAAERAQVEADLGLSPCAIRLGVVGAPRREKDVQRVLDAFHACSRDDLQLLVVCLQDEHVPDDPRIVALPASHVPEHVYYRRLVAIDALVLPFEDGMLMTGTVFDAIGAGKAALISDWPLLHAVLGDAAIAYGATREDLTRCLDALSIDRVGRSAAAMRALQARTDWSGIALQTHALLEEIAAR